LPSSSRWLNHFCRVNAPSFTLEIPKSLADEIFNASFLTTYQFELLSDVLPLPNLFGSSKKHRGSFPVLVPDLIYLLMQIHSYVQLYTPPITFHIHTLYYSKIIQIIALT